MDLVHIESKFADKQGEIMVVELGGHIDQSNNFQLQKMFDNIIQSGCFKVIVNFGKLYYMSSAGWGVFIGEIKRFRDNGGDIKLANMNSDIFEVFQLLELYHILEDYETVREAAYSFNSNLKELNLINDHSADNIKKEIPDSKKIVDVLEFDEINPLEKQDKEIVVQRESEPDEIFSFVSGTSNSRIMNKHENIDFVPLNFEEKIKLSELPIYEKVKRIIAQNPFLGVWGIRKILLHEHFGYTRIGIFELARLLRDLNLNTKQKRHRYYRSC